MNKLDMRFSLFLILFFFSCDKSTEFYNSQELLNENLKIQSSLNQEKLVFYQTLVESNLYDNGAIPEIKSILKLKEQLTNGSIDSDEFSALITKLDTIKIENKDHKVGDEYILNQLKKYNISDLNSVKIKMHVLNLIAIQLNRIVDYCINYSFNQRVYFDQYIPILYPNSLRNYGDSLDVNVGFMAFDEKKLDLFIDGEQVTLRDPKRIKHEIDRIHLIRVKARNDNGIEYTFDVEQKLN